jgi:ABC-type Mn2+/Zn2+ transport system permease subunit
MNLQEFMEILSSSFMRPTLISLFLISILSSLLSPIVVLSQKSYLSEALGHLILPGVFAGVALAEFFSINKLLVVCICAFLTGLIGLKSQFILEKKLRSGYDSVTIVLLGLFFSFGVLLSKITQSNFDLHAILFGDPLAIENPQIVLLGFVLVVSFILVVTLKNHFNAWLCDPEFAIVSGYKVKLVENVFVGMITSAILVGIWTVGTLMMTAFLVLPQVIQQKSGLLSYKTFVTMFLICLFGISASILYNTPVGATCVFLGGCIVILKTLFASSFPTHNFFARHKGL